MKTNVLLIGCVSLLLGVAACKTRSANEAQQAGTSSAATKTAEGADNSKTSLDWAGMYTGSLPCLDCEGIETSVLLKKDSTFELNTKYRGKPGILFASKGSFSWDEDGGRITLKDTRGSKLPVYQVGENTLTQVDMNGKPLSGNNAQRYVLTKVEAGITGKYWKLTELNGKKIGADGKVSKEIHMTLKPIQQSVTGNAACNSFFGSYELKEGNRIHFSGIASTKMACPNLETETEFLNMLGIADNYSILEDTLILNKAKMAPLARFEVVYLR